MARHVLSRVFQLFPYAQRVLAGATLVLACTPHAGAQPVAASPDLPVPPSSIGFHNTTMLTIPDSGVATPYPLTTTVSGFAGTVSRLYVQLNGVTHARLEDLDILLVAPNSFRTLLLSDIPGSMVDGSILLYASDTQTAGPLDGGGIVPASNIGSDDTFPPPGPAGPFGASLDFMNGYDPNGTWSLYVVDDTPNMAGSIGGFTLFIEPRFTLQPFSPMPTFGSVQSTIMVSGVTRPITFPSVSVFIGHANVGELSLALRGPDGTTVPLLQQGAAAGNNLGTACETPTTFSAQGTLLSSGSAPYVGTYRAVGDLFALSGKSGSAVNGPWTLTVSDGVPGTAGVFVCWSLDFNTRSSGEAPVQLTATSIAGNQLSLRWTQPRNHLNGAEPVGYLVEGGVNPGETLAQIPVPAGAPATTVTAPNGAFYVRVRAVYPGEVSAPSNDIRVFVNTPAPPSMPENLRVTQNGSSVDLSWTNTFAGGIPTGLALDVSGAATTTLPLAMGNSVSVANVPSGGYQVRLRALNAAGSSAATPVYDIGVPFNGCLGAPATPIRLTAYSIGRTAYVSWEQPQSGGAATHYVLSSSGALTGDVVLTAPSIAAAVGPGTYWLTVTAVNQCGASAPTAVASFQVP